MTRPRGGSRTPKLPEAMSRAVCISCAEGLSGPEPEPITNGGCGSGTPGWEITIASSTASRQRLDQPRRPFGAVAAAVGRGEDQRLLAARTAEVVGEGQGRRRRRARRSLRPRPSRGRRRSGPSVGDRSRAMTFSSLTSSPSKLESNGTRRDLAALDRREALLDEVGGRAIAARARRAVGGEGDDRRAVRPPGSVEGRSRPVPRAGREPARTRRTCTTNATSAGSSAAR